LYGFALQNVVDINSNATYVANQTGESGLRFTDLRLGSQEAIQMVKYLVLTL
jgi:hypothetical protein